MGFFSKKRTIFGSKTKKIAAIFCNRGIQTVRSQTFPTSNQKTEAHTEEKRSRRICCYDRGLKFEASLETRVYVSCPPVRQCTELADDSKSSELADWAELQRCNLQGVCTFLLPLALRRATVLSCCIFPLCLLWVFEDTGTYDSKQSFSRPTEIHFEICENCRCAFLCTFCVTLFYSHPQFSSHPLLISRKKKFPDKVDENLYQDMGPWYEKFFIRKSCTFRQLPTNQPPDVCL